MGRKQPRRGSTRKLGARRHRGLGTMLGLGVIATLVIAIVAVVIVVTTMVGKKPDDNGSHGRAPSEAQGPTSQPADCPDVQVISIPGTWESSATDDPYHPTFNKASLMLKITAPLEKKFNHHRADIYTVPYTAQFKRPGFERELSYAASRRQGTEKTNAKMAAVHKKCPLTNFVLTGFSQGAVIAGDIASDIGNGRSAIPADRLLFVGLIADGRRDGTQVNNVGSDPTGVGAESLLGGVNVPFYDIELRGPRVGGFGTVKSKTYSICATGDLVCDSPKDAFNLGNAIATITHLSGALKGPIHAMYGTTKYWQLGGQPATVWMLNRITQVIDHAPHPAHN